MKQLIDILNESIFDIDDKQIIDKTGDALNCKISNACYNTFKEHYNISKEELLSILIDIRDNNIGVNNIYYKCIKNKMQQYMWTVYFEDEDSLFRIYLDTNGRSTVSLNIKPKEPYRKFDPSKNMYMRDSNPFTSSYGDYKQYIVHTSVYLREAIDKIMQSTDSKYDKFKNLFKQS